MKKFTANEADELLTALGGLVGRVVSLEKTVGEILNNMAAPVVGEAAGDMSTNAKLRVVAHNAAKQSRPFECDLPE